MPTPTDRHGNQSPRADAGALAAALLFFAFVAVFIASCGTDDLVFPGNIPDTPTVVFTLTPTPGI